MTANPSATNTRSSMTASLAADCYLWYRKASIWIRAETYKDFVRARDLGLPRSPRPIRLTPNVCRAGNDSLGDGSSSSRLAAKSPGPKRILGAPYRQRSEHWRAYPSHVLHDRSVSPTATSMFAIRNDGFTSTPVIAEPVSFDRDQRPMSALCIDVGRAQPARIAIIPRRRAAEEAR
jgi:hypothetical protein